MKILIVHGDSGGGHIANSNIIKIALEKAGHEVLQKSFSKTTGVFSINQDKTYKTLTTYLPAVWEFFVNYASSHVRMIPINLYYYLIQKNTIRKYIDENNPDIVLNVFTMNPFILSYIRKKYHYKFKLYTFITDLVYIPGPWIDKNNDKIIFPNNESYEFTVNKGYLKGIEHKCFQISRYLLHPNIISLLDSLAKRDEVAISLLPSGKKTILIAGGGEGLEKMFDIARAIDETCLNVKIHFSLGKDKVLEKLVQSVKWRNEFESFGWTNKFYEWELKSDIIISKAGPMMIEESLAFQKFLIIYGYVKGQETLNPDYAVKRGAIFSENPKSIANMVNRLSLNDLRNQDYSTPIKDSVDELVKMIIE